MTSAKKLLASSMRTSRFLMVILSLDGVSLTLQSIVFEAKRQSSRGFVTAAGHDQDDDGDDQENANYHRGNDKRV
jgi:hypothetical protein